MADHNLETPALPSGTMSDHLAVQTVGTFTNMFEWPDEDFKAKEDVTHANRPPLPQPADHLGWREWEKGETKRLKPVLAKRYRPAVNVNRKDVTVTYDGDNMYRILVHDPEPYPGEPTVPRPAVLWYHGGGWAHGSPEMDAQRADYLASELRAVVFNVDYRLIPEISWPKNHNDVYHSIGWAIENAKGYNVDPTRLALWGQSAGAHLAAGAALRDADEHNPPRIRLVSLTVPVVCDYRSEPPPLNARTQIELTQMPKEIIAQVMTVLRDLTGSDAPLTDRYFSPLLSKIPANHPPTYISVGGLDRLRDGGIAYAVHLRKYGIDTQLEVVPGVPHAYTSESETYVAKQYWMDQVKAFTLALHFDWKQ